MLRHHSARRVFATSARRLCTTAETVTVSVAEARAKTAAAMKMIGWDEEDAALQAEIMTAAGEHRRRPTRACSSSAASPALETLAQSEMDEVILRGRAQQRTLESGLSQSCAATIRVWSRCTTRR